MKWKQCLNLKVGMTSILVCDNSHETIAITQFFSCRHWILNCSPFPASFVFGPSEFIRSRKLFWWSYDQLSQNILQHAWFEWLGFREPTPKCPVNGKVPWNYFNWSCLWDCWLCLSCLGKDIFHSTRRASAAWIWNEVSFHSRGPDPHSQSHSTCSSTMVLVIHPSILGQLHDGILCEHFLWESNFLCQICASTDFNWFHLKVARS